MLFIYPVVFLMQRRHWQEEEFFLLISPIRFPNWEQLSGAVEVSGLFDYSGLLGVETKENKPFLIQPQAVFCFN